MLEGYDILKYNFSPLPAMAFVHTACSPCHQVLASKDRKVLGCPAAFASSAMLLLSFFNSVAKVSAVSSPCAALISSSSLVAMSLRHLFLILPFYTLSA